jgi:DNA polymerase-3 subunit alpha
MSSINRRTIESLALAGAFDCFSDIKREDFFEKNNKDESFAEILIRYGQLFQNDKMQSSASLFGFDEDQALTTAARPQVIRAVPWADTERLDKEKELVGMYLSAHPLDPYYMEINYGCSHNIKTYLEETPADGKELSFGGMVVSFDAKPTKSGGQFGIMKIEDYNGSTELRFFGQDFINFRNYGVVGMPIVVTGRYQKRFKSEELRFNVTNIRLLQEMKGQLINSITLHLSKEEVTETLHKLISEHISSSTENRGTLSLRIYDPEINRSIKMTSGVKIPINKQLIDMLKDMDIEYHVNE